MPPAVVYLVQHARPKDEDNEDIKLIGIYSTRERAEAAVARALLQPGFRDWPDEFHIGSIPLDRDHWTEGFVTIRWEDIPEEHPS
ncbi:DUF7336 domain-containing protein [Longimicrobium sp.]|uniref:DUF7336 domain-containing protein n=1 Tax=Longimicrobium sp. TaxID=2029185 RepID=UPI002E31AF4B|nr:hypothetical protein [Longimicrobium sp.]HEX6039739.1 hypothetical protein [Longimicrobium sp.]